jgi:glycosyltransferase involved in cell wall biosynthesis
LPVLAFDTGALPELVCGGAGRIVPYGGDPWKLEQPDVPGLARAAADILDDQARFRKAARARAEEAFGLDHMVDAYLEVLLA